MGSTKIPLLTFKFYQYFHPTRMIQNTLTNIYIIKADGSNFGTRVSEFLKLLKTYPTVSKPISLSSSEDFDHPLPNILVDHRSFDRFSIQLSTDYPCPEFSELIDLVRKRKLQWAIICVSVYSQGSILWRGDFDYFCDNFFSNLWKNYYNPQSLPSPSSGTKTKVTIEEVEDGSTHTPAAGSYPISAYQVSQNTSQPFNGVITPLYSGSQYQDQNQFPYVNVDVIQTYRPRAA